MSKRQSIYASLMLLWPMLAYGSQDPLALPRDWIPASLGDRWTYAEEILSGDRSRPQIERWQRQETTIAVEAIPQGVVIKRRVEFLHNTAPPDWIMRGPRGESNILVHNNCLCYLNDSQNYVSPYGKDSSGSELSAEFLKDLASGQVLSDVCLPLRKGKTWGDPEKGRWLWTVAGSGRRHADDPVSVTPRAWRIEGQLASGDHNYMWFEQGIGLTAARTYHNGTYIDYRVRLLRFEPGSVKTRR